MGNVHIGTMGWSYNFWLGTFYPNGTPPDRFLTEYSKHFDTVEVDNTFYRIPDKETVAKWRDQTPKGFLFSAKIPRVITHQKMLRNCEQEMARFIDSISNLQPKLGSLLLQLPPMFKSEHISSLTDFLRILPKGYRFAVEVRNKKLLNDSLYSLLRENRVALVMVDSPFMPQVDVVTADFAYMRWEGDRRKVKGTLGEVEVDRMHDIEMWAEKLKDLLGKTSEVFGYFSKYYSGNPTGDAKQLLSLLGSNPS
ncbi:MAG TPA: DUF72 domain-containing protein [Candidatus Acidoferrum sp.]|jgi:uncharacterized protein YecE (DUF72 family)|nr:DUF72 domain-containing protein [Candidatus Acidoferrum sp.]